MYKPFKNFIFRTSTISYEKLNLYLSSPESLLDSFQSSFIQEAIFVASPVLYNEIHKLRNGEIENIKEAERIQSSMVRYLSRMCTRCTPFGLFAGCGVGEIGEQTNVALDGSINRVTRLDMYFLSTLYETLTKIPEIRNALKFYPNTSLYKVGKRVRYIEILYAHSQRKYQIAEVEYSRYLNKILVNAQSGKDIMQLAKVLISEDISFEDAIDYVNELTESQIIVPELSQTVIGEDYLERIIYLLESIKHLNPVIIEKIKSVKESLFQLDTGNDSFPVYKTIIEIIKELDISFEEHFIFQVDLIKNTTIASIGNNVRNEISSAISFLNKITPSYKNEKLKQFQEDFYSRYEEHEIPLLEALDSDLGLGYPSNRYGSALSPLIEGLILPQRVLQTSKSNILQSLLYQRTIELPNKDKMEIELTDNDIEGLNANWEDLPHTFYTMFEVIQADSDNTLLRLQVCGGSSAANLLSRFAHTDKRIEMLVKDITAKEQELVPDAVIAEIVHSPEARVGNILFRPHIRNYELLFMSDSDLPQDQIILLSDLMLSVKNARLVLRSKRLNKEVIPRLTSAHNYHYKGMLSVYRFLGDFQVQAKRNVLYFNWGQELEEKRSFLPRVRYKNTILSLATWVVKIEEIRYLLKIKEQNQLLDEIEKWREKRFLPQYVLMHDGDNELFVNWKNILSVRSLFSIINKRLTIKFTEFLFNPETAVVKDAEDKTYKNEFIVAFYKNNE